MTDDDDFERRYAAALRARDPVAALDAIDAVDPDGARVAALLIARLRFERAIQGSPAVAALFEADARAFADEMRAYHRAMPAIALDPAGEARAFLAWRARR